MSDARVLLCQPVYGHVAPAAHLSQVQLVLYAGTHGNLTGIIHARDTYIDWGRNHIVKLAYEHYDDFTHMLWVDGDIIAPEDTLERLLHSLSRDEVQAENPAAIGALYVKKGTPYEPVAYDFEPQPPDANGRVLFQGNWDRTRKLDITRDALYMCHGLGMGCTLVTRAAMDAVITTTDGTPFQTTVGYGEDVWFFHWAHQLSFSSWLDTSVRCRHVGDYEFSEADWERARDE